MQDVGFLFFPFFTLDCSSRRSVETSYNIYKNHFHIRNYGYNPLIWFSFYRMSLFNTTVLTLIHITAKFPKIFHWFLRKYQNAYKSIGSVKWFNLSRAYISSHTKTSTIDLNIVGVQMTVILSIWLEAVLQHILRIIRS